MVTANPIIDIKTDVDYESNLVSIDYRSEVLSVIVDAGQDKLVQVDFFQQIWAFRQMEEGDLSYYWESGQFNESYLAYEISSGGWLSKEGSDKDILSIARSSDWLNEWFIPTSNMSLFVLSNSRPKFAILPNPR